MIVPSTSFTMTSSGPKLFSQIYETSGSDFFWAMSGWGMYAVLEKILPTKIRLVTIRTSHGYEFRLSWMTWVVVTDAAGNPRYTVPTANLKKNSYIKLFKHKNKARKFWGGPGTFYEGYERADDQELTIEDALNSTEYYAGLISGLIDKKSDIKILHDNRMMIAIPFKDEKSAKLFQRMSLFLGIVSYREESTVLYPEGLLKQLIGLYRPHVENDVTAYLKIHLPLVVVKDKRVLSYATKVTEVLKLPASKQAESEEELGDVYLFLPENIEKVPSINDLRRARNLVDNWSIDVGGVAANITQESYENAERYINKLTSMFEELPL